MTAKNGNDSRTIHLRHYRIYRFNYYDYYCYGYWKLLKCETDIPRVWVRVSERVFAQMIIMEHIFMRIHELIYCFIYFMKRIKWYLSWMFAFLPLSLSLWTFPWTLYISYALYCSNILPLLRKSKLHFELIERFFLIVTYKIQFIPFLILCLAIIA